VIPSSHKAICPNAHSSALYEHYLIHDLEPSIMVSEFFDPSDTALSTEFETR